MLLPLKCRGARGATNPSKYHNQIACMGHMDAESNLRFAYYHNVHKSWRFQYIDSFGPPTSIHATQNPAIIMLRNQSLSID